MKPKTGRQSRRAAKALSFRFKFRCAVRKNKTKPNHRHKAEGLTLAVLSCWLNGPPWALLPPLATVSLPSNTRCLSSFLCDLSCINLTDFHTKSTQIFFLIFKTSCVAIFLPVCHVRAPRVCPVPVEARREDIRSPGTRVKTVLSHHMGAGN